MMNEVANYLLELFGIQYGYRITHCNFVVNHRLAKVWF